MGKKRRQCYVFSVYSHEIENYPYKPYVANSIISGVQKYIAFLKYKNAICDGAELHWIGTCESYWDKSLDSQYPVYENIQPLMLPQRITFKDDWLGRLCVTYFVLGLDFHEKVKKYFERLFVSRGNRKDNKKGNK